MADKNTQAGHETERRQQDLGRIPGVFLPLRHSMELAREMGAGALAITGNLGFYGKSGFVVAKTRGIRYADDPDADYFLVAELEPGFLTGVSGTYRDPAGYFVDETEADQFDASFPPKEKLKLPGQIF